MNDPSKRFHIFNLFPCNIQYDHYESMHDLPKRFLILLSFNIQYGHHGSIDGPIKRFLILFLYSIQYGYHESMHDPQKRFLLFPHVTYNMATIDQCMILIKDSSSVPI
jgi:hypothetical protein